MDKPKKYALSLTVLLGGAFFMAVPAHAITITGIQVEPGLDSAKVTWTTDVPATSQAIMLDDQFLQPLRRYPEPKDSSLSTRHEVSLDKLIPNTSYSLYVASFDASGNLATSYRLDPTMGNSGKAAQFTTSKISASSPFNWRLDVSGPKSAYAGSDLYLSYDPVLIGGSFLDSNASTSNFFVPAFEVSGLPPGASLHAICRYNDNPQDGAQDNFKAGDKEACFSKERGSLRLRTGSNTPPGQYTVSIVAQDGLSPNPARQKTYSYSFTILPAPAPINQGLPAGIPPLPSLKEWESQMLSLGDKWCDGKSYSFGYEGDVWYYDGGRVYMQIADYTGNPAKWKPCADSIIRQYADYINQSGGRVPTIAKFPFGLAMHYLRYKDDESKRAVTALYQSVSDPYINGAAPVRGALSDPYHIRDLSYAIDSMVAGEYIGLPRSPWLTVAVDGALGQIDQLYSSDPWQFDQTFMGGLLAESLITYYGRTQDPRIPPAIKKMLDWYWENAVDRSTGKLSYHPLYVPQYYVTELNNLIAPAYAWYWNISGNNAYQERGDLLFANSLDSDISWNGKIFSQNYKWSFDYVRWRQGAKTSTVDPSSNNQALSAFPKHPFLINRQDHL